MSRRLIPILNSAIVLIATFGAICATADETAPPEATENRTSDKLESEVARLIGQLDSNSRTERLQAEKSLLAIGPDALEYLPPPAQLSAPAAREAVRRLRIDLELRKARSSVTGSSATLQGSQTLDEMLISLSRQTGNTIVAPLPADELQQSIDLQLRDISFWQAIETLSVPGRFRFDIMSSGQLQLSAAESNAPDGSRHSFVPGELTSTHSGPFRIGLQGAKLRPQVSENVPRRLRLELSLLGEPRLRPLFLKFANADFQATIPPQNTLKPTSPTGQIELPFGDRGALAQIDFDVPDELNPSSATASGKFTVLTAAGPERFEFANLPVAKGVSRRRGGVTVSMDEIDIVRKLKTSDASISIIVAYDTGGPAFESHRSWFFQNEAWIETGDKNRIEMSEPPRTSRQNDGAITIEYQFRDLPLETAKCRFNYVAPTLLINVPIGFEFKDVPVANGLKASTP